MTRDIDIIIVHYHAADGVAAAQRALMRDATESGLAIRVFVSDNGSTPSERAILRSLDVTYLDVGRDAGYSGGINFAVPHTVADTLIVMNEDVIVQPGCLAALRNELLNGAAVAGPTFWWDSEKLFLLPCTEERTRRNELVKVAGKRDMKKLERARRRWRDHARRHWQAIDPIATTALSGALLAFRRSTWETVGPWDDGYQMYFDENDWLFRVERAGQRAVYVPRAEAVHLHNPKLMGEPDRAQWVSESFLRFGNEYYGEHFMRRLFLVGSRTPVIPARAKLTADSDGASVDLEIPEDAAFPVWVEFTPSPFGYPAAATQITDATTRRWRLPKLVGLPFLTGTYYLLVVDDTGRELASYEFDRQGVFTETAVDAKVTA